MGANTLLAKLKALVPLEEADAALQYGEWLDGVAGNCDLVAFNGEDVTGLAVVNAPNRVRLIAAARNLLADGGLAELIRAVEERDALLQQIADLKAAHAFALHDATSQRDEARKDAERYQWLRDHADSMALHPALTVAQVKGWGLEGWSGDNLTVAIDRAMNSNKEAL